MPEDDPIPPVRRQLEAYNARDIEGFMRCWAADATIHDFPDRLLAAGADAIRARHEARFREPHLHGALLSREAIGNLVVDREVVTRSFPDGAGQVDVLALYEVEGGLIRRAWFRAGPRRPEPAFRTATPEDEAAIRALVREAYARWVPVIGREPRPMFADYASALREHRFDLLYRGADLVGLIETVLRDDHLWIENVAVRPQEQGGGIGRRLLAHAEALARAAGHREVRLLTNAAFGVNIALYERLGYAITGREPFLSGVAVHMAKGLDGTAA